MAQQLVDVTYQSRTDGSLRTVKKPKAWVDQQLKKPAAKRDGIMRTAVLNQADAMQVAMEAKRKFEAVKHLLPKEEKIMAGTATPAPALVLPSMPKPKAKKVEEQEITSENQEVTNE